ncbi:DegQ family serine endoprotease, partial [Beggiatoa alba]|nr:DegQ family serine endoprotease [Beggiatoa alba]
STKQQIKVNKKSPHGFQIPDMPEGSPWNDLFKRFFEDRRGPEGFKSQSLGSGFIVDTDGYIVTNHHVVKDADEIIVRLSDRRELVAKLIGSDERSDIALLKIDAESLPVVKIGDSEKLKVGEWAMAIGSPFGFDHSVSVGVISAMGRNNLPNSNYVPFIQTDVAINPGNSGGPLFNLKGEVIGINSQIYTRTGGFMGLSFSIPINVAMNVVEQIKKSGHVTRGWLGVLIQEVNRELAESFGMKQPRGAAVLRVLQDSPAEKAGFKIGDVIVKFGKKEIYRSSDLPLAVGTMTIGKKVKVRVIREGNTKTLTVRVAELPDQEQLADVRSPSKSHKVNKLGLSVMDISTEQRQQYGLDKQGVIVKRVIAGPAGDAGIRRGDILVKLNYKDINSVKDFNKVLKGLPKGKSVPIFIQRNKSPVFLALKIPN